MRSRTNPQPRRITASDVARLTGVSIATVSMVVNGRARGRVSEATVKKVEEAVAELGYRVDPVASSLATGSGHLVVLISPDLMNPYFGQVLQGLMDHLPLGLRLVLISTKGHDSPTVRDVESAMSMRPSALLVVSPTRVLEERLPTSIPVVYLDATAETTARDAVRFDLEKAAHGIVDHLVALGHRKAAYFDAETHTPTFSGRATVVRKEAAAYALRLSDLKLRSALDVDHASRTFARVWPRLRNEGVTCVICATDIQAYGVMDACRSFGLDIPRDVSVTGFDNLDTSALVGPGLTTFSLPGNLMGQAGAELLTQRLAEPSGEIRTRTVEGSLYVRGSTGPSGRPALPGRSHGESSSRQGW